MLMLPQKTESVVNWKRKGKTGRREKGGSCLIEERRRKSPGDRDTTVVILQSENGHTKLNFDNLIYGDGDADLYEPH